MRNERGQYLNLKEIASNGPSYARGCPSCTFGIVRAPELTGATSLYLERLVQAIDGDITFCTCEAGKAYRATLLNRRQQLLEEARADKRMMDSARLKTHPDIDAARLSVHTARAKRVPTMHYEPTQAELA